MACVPLNRCNVSDGEARVSERLGAKLAADTDPLSYNSEEPPTEAPIIMYECVSRRVHIGVQERGVDPKTRQISIRYSRVQQPRRSICVQPSSLVSDICINLEPGGYPIMDREVLCWGCDRAL